MITVPQCCVKYLDFLCTSENTTFIVMNVIIKEVESLRELSKHIVDNSILVEHNNFINSVSLKETPLWFFAILRKSELSHWREQWPACWTKLLLHPTYMRWLHWRYMGCLGKIWSSTLDSANYPPPVSLVLRYTDSPLLFPVEVCGL